MITASSTDSSITVAFTLHDGNGQASGDGPVNASVEDPMDVVDHDTEVERAIDELIDGAPPPDWDDPAAIAARREHLTETACRAAQLVVELLVHNRLTTAQSMMKPTAKDAPVIEAARGVGELHRALCSYRRDTGCWDGLEVVQGAMAGEAGPGVAAVATELLTRLWADLSETMLEQAARPLSD